MTQRDGLKMERANLLGERDVHTKEKREDRVREME